MIIRTNLFPEGRTRAITMSYDDAPKPDKDLIPIFNTYGFKGTFHVNSRRIEAGEKGDFAEARQLYSGHEVSLHTDTHPCLYNMLTQELYDELMIDKRRAESIFGYTIRGMSYPYGQYDDRIIEIMRLCGMKYSRTTRSTNDFNLPLDFLAWHPTCHHNADLEGLLSRFMEKRIEWVYNLPTFYIWGHSYEFDAEHDNNLYQMENFCKKASGLDGVWYATNIEIYDYVTAARNLEISAERKYVFNPSRLSVWVTVNDERVVEIKPGENAI